MNIQELTSDLLLLFWERVGRICGLDSSEARYWFHGEGEYATRYFVAMEKGGIAGIVIWEVHNILGGNKVTLDLALCEASGHDGTRRVLLLQSLIKMRLDFRVLEIHGAVDDREELMWFRLVLQGVSGKVFRTMSTDLPGGYSYFSLTL